MKIIAINGYKSFIGKYFYQQNNKKIKIINFKKDINDIKELKKFIRKSKITHFIHFAGLSRHKCNKKKSECLKTNYMSIKSIINFFNTLQKKPIFIFISSSHVYGHSKKKLDEKSKTNPLSLYAKLKLKSENYIKKNYSKYSILRLFNVYGENQPNNFFISDMIKKIKNKEIIKIDNSSRDFIHVSEVSNIIYYIIINEILTTINIGTGKGKTLKYIISKITKKIGIKPLVNLSKKTTNIVANISFLKSQGYKFKNNAKYLDI
jgi:UDP-glucose 4-epimerase